MAMHSMTCPCVLERESQRAVLYNRILTCLTDTTQEILTELGRTGWYKVAVNVVVVEGIVVERASWRW